MLNVITDETNMNDEAIKGTKVQRYTEMGLFVIVKKCSKQIPY